MRVDIHAHAFPAAYVDALATAGQPGAAFVRSLAAGDAPAELDRRLATMDAAGVDVQVLSPSSVMPSLGDAAAASAAALLLNDSYGAISGARPDRFASFAVVPLPHVEAALASLDDALARPGVVGLAVTTSVGGSPIADARFEPLLAELDRRSAVIFIHPAGTAGGSSLVEALGLTWALGAPIEDTISVTALLARGIPTRYPNLRIVNAHLGGALPMLLRRLDSQFPRVAPDAPEPPSVAARRMWYDTVSEAHPAALTAARMAYGADRLLLGTDYPFVRGDEYRAAVDYVAAGAPNPAESSAILDRNGAGLLGLGGR